MVVGLIHVLRIKPRCLHPSEFIVLTLAAFRQQVYCFCVKHPTSLWRQWPSGAIPAGKRQTLGHEPSAYYSLIYCLQYYLQCGPLKEVRLVKNRAGKSKGFTYIEYLNEVCMYMNMYVYISPYNMLPLYIIISKPVLPAFDVACMYKLLGVGVTNLFFSPMYWKIQVTWGWCCSYALLCTVIISVFFTTVFS